MDAKERKHFDVESGLIVDRFINSFKQKYPILATKSLIDLQFKRLSNEPTPTFMETLNIFRQIFAIRGQTSGSSSTPEESNRQTGNTPSKECICGKMHWYSDCPYMNGSRRLKGWIPDRNIVQKIHETLKDPKIKAHFDMNPHEEASTPAGELFAEPITLKNFLEKRRQATLLELVRPQHLATRS